MEGKINGKIDMIGKYFENFSLINNQEEEKKITAL